MSWGGEIQPLFPLRKRPTWIWPVAIVALTLSPFLLFLLLIALRDLGQPTPITPDRSAIAGTWTNPDGARLVLRADGTYTATKMPFIADGTGTFSFDDLPVDGTGTWTIQPWDASSGSGGGLMLSADGGRTNTSLETTGNAAHPSLYASIGDPDEDNDFNFVKQG